MKKLTLRATDENILKSIKNDTFGRSEEIKNFIEALDNIDENMFISLDARWGEGKTFYIRQIEMTLKYALLNNFAGNEDNKSECEEMSEFFKGNAHLKSICPQKSYLPIYYDAWLHDDHDDALMSLVFVLIKECNKYVDTTMQDASTGGKIKTLITSTIYNKLGIPLDAIGKIKDKEILSSIKTAEEIKLCVKGIFDSLLCESAQKVVIFIDELDRCKPSFAIELLERIKHYFEDDRIIFVISVNKAQLVHTISNFYGNDFDSTRYLNKFFDINVYLPATTFNVQIDVSGNRYQLQGISASLIEYYKLTLRDALIYKQNIESLSEILDDHRSQGSMLSLFVPIILVLDIFDQSLKYKFLNGDESVLKELSHNIKSIKEFICRFGDKGMNTPEDFEKGYKEIIQLYKHFFGEKTSNHYMGKINVNEKFKTICIDACNGDFSAFIKSIKTNI